MKRLATSQKLSKNLGFYIDRIDHFYGAYPHAANVTVGEVLQCLSDKPWKPCAEVAKIFLVTEPWHASKA